MRLLLLFFAAILLRADELELVIRAQTDFDRVELSATPQVKDTIACMQSQAAVLPVVRLTELSLVHYRKALCTLLNGVLTRNVAEYRTAAREFDEAIETWSAGLKPKDEKPPLSAGLRVLAAVARVKAEPAPQDLPKIENELALAVNQPACPAALMAPAACQRLVETGRFWLGWALYQQNKLSQAAQVFAAMPESGWREAALGRQDMESRRYADAVPLLQKAAEQWSTSEKYPPPGIAGMLRPRPDVAKAFHDLGVAQFLAKDYSAAAASMSTALKMRPEDAEALFVRARAEEMLGSSQPALADFERASRAAFAQVNVPYAAGAAHLYRGIWLFRRKDYGRAEDEFSSALNFDPGPVLRSDVAAWRYMAAVAGGACQQSAKYLESALASVSDFFPRQEAETWLQGCREKPAVITQK